MTAGVNAALPRGWSDHRRRLAFGLWLAAIARDSEPPRGVPPHGDREAARERLDITELFQAHGDAMYRSAVSIVRDHALAEDVVQESLVRAWRALDTFRGDSSPRTWLLRITHNTAVSMLRRLRDSAIDPLDMPESPVETADTEDLGMASALLAAIEEALFELDELSRAVVVLREIENLSYEEISELLRVPLPTVKTRLFRARRHLSDVLEGWT